MSEAPDRYLQIREFLQEQYPRAVSISTMARELEMNRGSVAKYLEVLLSHGHVTMKPFGRSKLYQSSQNIPFDDLFDYLSDAIIILDADLRILMVNKSFIRTFNLLKGKNIIGSELSRIRVALFQEQNIQENILRIIREETYINEMLVIEKGTERVFLTEFVSTVFPSISFTGRCGAMISLRNITNWKRAEDALKTSERKIRTLFEDVPSGIILFQEDGTILNANRASLAILGLKNFTELEEAKIFDIICSRERIRDLIHQRKTADLTLSCNFDLLKKHTLTSSTRSGIAYFQMVFAPVCDQVWSDPGEYFILFLDITAKKLAENELKARLRGVSTNLPGIIYQFYATHEGRWGMHYVDERSLDVYGLDPEPQDSFFDRLSACIAPEDRGPWLASVQEVIQSGSSWDFESRFVKPTGEEMYIRGISQPIQLQNETIWNGIFLDITDRKRVELALKKSEERFRSITKNLPGIVYQFYVRNGDEWGMHYVDERSRDVYGLDPEPKDTWLERYATCIAPEDRERWHESIRDVVKRGAPWEFEGRFIKSSGEEMDIRVLSEPVRIEDEMVWNGIILDITEYKRAERALNQSRFKEMRYHSFFENTCNGVLIYKPINGGEEYILKDVNTVTAMLLRMKKEDLIGKRLFEEFPDLPDPSVRDMLKRVLRTENPEFVPPLKYRNREDFPWITHYVFKLPSGEIASFMIDVSEEVRQEERKRLETSDDNAHH